MELRNWVKAIMGDANAERCPCCGSIDFERYVFLQRSRPKRHEECHKCEYKAESQILIPSIPVRDI